MIKIKFFILLILVCFLTLGCKKYYSRMINNQNHILLTQDIYYRIEVDKKFHYNRNKIKNFSWTKFSYSEAGFANLKFYITGEKLPGNQINDLKANFQDRIKRYYSHDKNTETIKLDQYLPVQNYAYIKHKEPTKTLAPVDNDWKKGHDWKDMGAGTEMYIAFIHNSKLIKLEINIEYLPNLKTIEKAQWQFNHKREKILEIIRNIYIAK